MRRHPRFGGWHHPTACVANTSGSKPNIRCPRTISVRSAEISVPLTAPAEH
ncbi:DUF1560 domain-containing protein [Rhodopirellula bahusiensis]|uniref:DUF1560 domain-containing protein n=1 Tax=Rhodopirellula bahusiensis TaxID=2014065 RepID=A0A2G1W2E5_9BACT|nr:DUF1560 domain-containing protein [Rhodopirellula bahusiensis]